MKKFLNSFLISWIIFSGILLYFHNNSEAMLFFLIIGFGWFNYLLEHSTDDIEYEIKELRQILKKNDINSPR